MTETEKATAGPWAIYKHPADGAKNIVVRTDGEWAGCPVLEVSGGHPDCSLEEDEANAELIVTAVNAHDALLARVAELERVLREIEMRAINTYDKTHAASRIAELAHAALAEDAGK